MKLTHTLITDALEIDIDVEYTPGDPGCHTLRNGDPGYPPTDDEFELLGYRAWLIADGVLPLHLPADLIRIEPTGDPDPIEKAIESWLEEDGAVVIAELASQRYEPDDDERDESRAAMED